MHDELRTNELGQPIGPPVDIDLPLPPIASTPMIGRRVEVVLLDPAAHANDLHDAFTAAPDAGEWTYLSYGPFDEVSFRTWLDRSTGTTDPVFFAVVDRESGRPCGMASYLNIDRQSASIEVGHIHFSVKLQRTAAATEAMALMMRRAFDSGFRRYEWKCDALNAPSRRAAERLGFRFEGIFRQATVYKGRNRDTAWFSVIDDEWPVIEAEFERWLDPSNFDAEGSQRTSLAARQV